MSEIQKFTNNEIKITNTVLSCHSSPLSGYMEDWWRPRKGNNLKNIIDDDFLIPQMFAYEL